MNVADSLDPREGEAKRNLKLAKDSKIEKVKLFNKSNPRSVRVRKNLLNDLCKN